MLDELAPVVDADAVGNEAWCRESMDDTEIERMRAFVNAVWTFSVAGLSAYQGNGLEAKSQPGPDEEEHEMPVRSHGYTGAAEEDVGAKRLPAMKANFRIDGDRRFYTAKLGAELIDVSSAPVMACIACKNVGRGMKHHWFHECPGFDSWGRCPSGRAEPASRVGRAVLRFPRWRGRRMACGVGRVEDAVEGGRNHLVGRITGILMGKADHGYILYPVLQVGPLGRLHAVEELEVAARQYLYQLWGLGYSQSCLCVAVLALLALEDMGWLPAFLSRRVSRCAKWASTAAVV